MAAGTLGSALLRSCRFARSRRVRGSRRSGGGRPPEWTRVWPMTTLSRDHVVVRPADPWRTQPLPLGRTLTRIPQAWRYAPGPDRRILKECTVRRSAATETERSMLSSLSTASSGMAASLDSQLLARRALGTPSQRWCGQTGEGVTMKSKVVSRIAALLAAALSVVVASLLVVPVFAGAQVRHLRGAAPMAPSRPSCWRMEVGLTDPAGTR